MAAPVVLQAAMRRTETPNAAMTTLASPTQGPTGGLSVWRVEMRAGQQGPLHVFDSEQVWHVLAGQVDVAVGGETSHLSPGDVVIIPAQAERQVTAVAAAEILVCGYGNAVTSVVGEDAPRGTPAWIS